MYEDLIKRMRCPKIHSCPMEKPDCRSCRKTTNEEAARAIEKLQAELEQVKKEKNEAIENLSLNIAMIALHRDTAAQDIKNMLIDTAEKCFPVELCRYCSKNKKGCGHTCYPEWRGLREREE